MIFDSSSIFHLFSQQRESILIDQYSIDFVSYEFGNIVWKCVHLGQKYSKAEGMEMLVNFHKILYHLNLHSTQFEKIYEISVNYHASFYDSAYVAAAQALNFPLVTEDKKLKNKVKGLIEVLSVTDL